MEKPYFVSIIIPVYNAARCLDRCLEAIIGSSYSPYEIIVVDDGSTDNSVETAREKEVIVLRMPFQSGPAAARNYGAQKAQGDVLFFVDADVLIQQDTVAQVVADFIENPNIAAVFGSYDDNPAEKDFLSQYRNLFHHFVHRQSGGDAVTFWAGCGAIRQEVFHAVGGFDDKMYSKPSIEDIELGYRMRRKGYRILLDKKLQVKHLKKWKMGAIIRTDILSRAVPWSKLILERQQMISDLNLKISDRISSGLVGLLIGILPFLFFEPRLLYGIFFILGIIIFLNRKLYSLFLRHRGLKFVFLAFPMHLLYYFYSGVTFVLCWGIYLLMRKR